jgi:hypothetical protein
MLESLGGKASKRKLRLLAAGCCRGSWRLLVREGSRKAVEAAERAADGQAARGEMKRAEARAWADASHVARSVPSRSYNRACAATDAAWCAAADIRAASRHIFGLDTVGPCAPGSARLLRDVFGNPFRPVALDPAWGTPTVLALAEAAYAERLLPSGELDPARLAVLADALEEASCSNPDILGHLRSPGPHVRGCWGVDAVLGRY